MSHYVAVLFFAASMLVGCPYDRLRPPYFQSQMEVVVEAHIVLIDGTEEVFMLEKGNRLLYSTDPKSLKRVTFIVDGDVIDEVDAKRIAAMLRCAPDPRDVTWYIEAGGLRPSVDCHRLTR